MKREHKTSGELPGGYRRLEYLECTGTQYINTTYVPNSTTCMFSDAQFLNSTSKNLAVVRWTESPTYYTIGIYKGSASGLVYYLGDFAYTYSNFNNSTQRFTAEIRSDGCYFSGQRITTDHPGTISNTFELFLFGFNNLGSSSFPAGGVRIFEFYVEEENEPKRRFVPAIRLSDNKPGLYDLCESTCSLTGTPFYINAGTGEFLYK